MDTALADLRLLADALLALALGGAVGWEREAAGKGAGLRTMMLVTLASYLFVEVSLVIAAEAGAGGANRVDPVRAVEAIVTGIAFVGAGLVFRDRGADRVHGLTTAASLLAVAPVGIAVALGRYVLAAGVTLLLLVVLRLLLRFEQRVFDNPEGEREANGGRR
jgi:putative Mg2+ transporter-C (MgtC) family protein